jgi:2-amino-4-hydroxy-6-hydroxymethyldihydropteridine diphosphokinase
MSKVILLFGSNIGNKAENITKALSQVSESLGEIIRTSSLYETAAWGNGALRPLKRQIRHIRR